MKNNKNFVSLTKKSQKVLGFDDGMGWWNCGNTVSLYKEHKLGNKTYYEPHLTFVLDKEYGVLSKMKDRANKKPSPKYHHYIKELLKQPFIKMIGGSSYRPENNFHFSDLSVEHQKEVLDANPNLIYNTESQDNLHKILMLLPKKRKYYYDVLRSKAAEKADLSKIDNVLLENLISSDYLINQKLILNSTLPLHLVERLADHPDQSVRYNLAERPNLPNYIIEKMANDKSIHVRSVIAERRDITPRAMEILSQSDEIPVLYHLTRNDNLPGHLIEDIASRTEYERVHRNLAVHPNTPQHLMERYFNDGDHIMHSYLAYNPNLPAHLAEKLINNNDYHVKEILASKRNLPPYLFKVLENIKLYSIEEALKKNPSYIKWKRQQERLQKTG